MFEANFSGNNTLWEGAKIWGGSAPVAAGLLLNQTGQLFQPVAERYRSPRFSSGNTELDGPGLHEILSVSSNSCGK